LLRVGVRGGILDPDLRPAPAASYLCTMRSIIAPAASALAQDKAGNAMCSSDACDAALCHGQVLDSVFYSPLSKIKKKTQNFASSIPCSSSSSH
jgi:hypothetical protein